MSFLSFRKSAKITGLDILGTPYGFSDWGMAGYFNSKGLVCEIDKTQTQLGAGTQPVCCRSELSSGTIYGDTYLWLSQEMELPADYYPDPATKEIFLQIHESDSPNFSVRAVGDRLETDFRYLDDSWQNAIKKDFSGQLNVFPYTLNIGIEAYLTRNQTGFLRCWINGEKVFDSQAELGGLVNTLYTAPSVNKGGAKHQFGLYKSDWSDAAARSASPVQFRSVILKSVHILSSPAALIGSDVPPKTTGGIIRYL